MIAVSLTSSESDHILGAIRNAVLIKTSYPGWTYKVYTEKKTKMSKLKSHSQIPDRILKKLQSLGAEVVYLDSDFTEHVPAPLWKYLVVDAGVDVFIVRDVEHRLGPREVEAVSDWLGAADPASVHCMRDHPSQTLDPITDSLWGGVNEKLMKRLNHQPMESLIASYVSKYKEQQLRESVAVFMEGQDHGPSEVESNQLITSGFLHDVIYSSVKDDIFCHDSVSCDIWPNSQPFRSGRSKYEYTGRKVDAFDTLPESIIPPPQNVSTAEPCRPIK